ncbi:MAG: carboxypeptidase [Armatimonadota bacterium]
MPELDLSRFYLYDELTAYLQAVAAEYPHLARLESIGKSYQGRDIWVMTLTRFATGGDLEKPAYWIDANIHAGEVTGGATTQYTIHYLTTRYGSDPQVTRLLERSAFYVCPRVSPDGVEQYLTTPHQVRSSLRPYPFEDEREGLYPEDVDGDGRILQMRVQDPKGAWKVSDKDPRLMRPREVGEEGGTYYHLYPEGLIRGWDGYTVKPAPPRHGLDLNRSFPADWGPESQQRGAGPFPLSEPETHALAQFFARHKNINGMQAYHTYSGVILRPYSGKPDDALPTHDLTVFKRLGDKGTELTGYPHTSVFHGFRYDPKTTLRGGFFDWLYEDLGIFGFSTELWDVISLAGIGEKQPNGVLKRDFIGWFRSHPEEDDLKLLQFNDEHGLEGFKTWTPFEHPQLGPVEIGGWDYKRFWGNAPAKFLPDIAHKNTLFTLLHAEVSPRLELKLAKVEPVSEGVWRLVAVLENTGFLPTYTSAKALEKKAVEPIRVKLHLGEGARLVSGEAVQEIGHLEGRSNKIELFGALPFGDQEKKLEWVVAAPSGSTVTLEAIAQRAGTVRQEIRLGAGQEQ